MPVIDSPAEDLVAGAPLTRRPAHPQHVAEYSLRPRLTVIALRVAEVVRFAGGCLFDQGMAGWDINVLTAEKGDFRPLRILGAAVHDLDTVLDSPVVWGACLRAVTVSAEMYDSEERVCRMVRNALKGGSAEVRLWGDTGRANQDPGAEVVRYLPSIAARAFKAHALAAAGLAAEETSDVEVFTIVATPCPSGRRSAGRKSPPSVRNKRP